MKKSEIATKLTAARMAELRANKLFELDQIDWESYDESCKYADDLQRQYDEAED